MAALASSGLMAGLLYGWLVSVIPGTSRADDAAYVQTMQQINVAIDRFQLAGGLDGPVGAMRTAYEGPWNRWHAARTAASVVAFGLVGTAARLEADVE